MANKKKKGIGVDFTDLQGDIKRSILPDDGHFGMSSEVWTEAQRIASSMPSPIKIYGDLSEADVADAIELSKGSEIQLKYWTDYYSAIDKYCRNIVRIRGKQSDTAQSVAEARVQTAEIEAELGKNLASLESKYRGIVANYRAEVQGIADSSNLELGKIAAKYSEGLAKKEAAGNADAKANQTPFFKQKETLADKFRKVRESKYTPSSRFPLSARREVM